MGIWENITKKYNPFTHIQVLKRELKVLQAGNLRPISADQRYQSGSHIHPKFPFATNALRDLAYNSDTMTIIHNALRREIFRNGYDLTDADKANTDQSQSNEQRAEEEESDDEKKEREKAKEKVLSFLEKVNENGQSILDVAYEIEDDFSIYDDAYLMFLNEYKFNEDGDFIQREDSRGKFIDDKVIREIIRGDPRNMGRVQNKYDRPGRDEHNNRLLVCANHRNSLITAGETEEEDKRCPRCGNECRQAYFFHQYGDEMLYYFEHEVIYKNKYRPSKRGGHSPMLTCWQKARTLLFMDKYIMDVYTRQRPPKGMLVFRTGNQAGVEKSWEEMLQRTKENPQLPAVLNIQDSSPSGGGKKFAEFFDFMRSLDEMQYGDARKGMIETCGAVYGVLPIYQGDVSTSGGLNNEGLQVTVTNRAVEAGQKIWNDSFFMEIMAQLDYPDFILLLNPSEEKDEMSELQRQQQTLINGQQAVNLGLQAEFNEDTGLVVIKDGTLEKTEIAPNIPSFGGGPNVGQAASGTPDAPTAKAHDEKDKRSVDYNVEKAVSIDANERLTSIASGGQGKHWHSWHLQFSKTSFDAGHSHKIDIKSGMALAGDTGHSHVLNSGVIKGNQIKKKDDKRKPFSRISDIIKEAIDDFVGKFKKQPSEAELNEALTKINADLKQEIEKATAKEFEKAYKAESAKTSQNIGIKVAFDVQDENALIALANRDVLKKAFADLSTEVSLGINNVIRDAYETGELDPKDIQEKIKELGNVTDFRAENIARTETSNVQGAARKVSYEKTGKFDTLRFDHIGPDDNRTTGTSKGIIAEIRKREKASGLKGVLWDEYIEIVTDISKQEFPDWTVNPDTGVSHYQSRHIFLQVS